MERLRYNEENRSVILAYIEGGGEESGVLLSDLQQKMLERWRMADEKIRQNKYRREQVARFLMGHFGVSRDTAFRDIVNAEHVFSSSMPLNKLYLYTQRIELLITEINKAYLDNDRDNAARLEKVLQKYIETYPDIKKVRSVKKIVYNIIQKNQTVVMNGNNQPQSTAELKTLGLQIAEELEGKDDY